MIPIKDGLVYCITLYKLDKKYSRFKCSACGKRHKQSCEIITSDSRNYKCCDVCYSFLRSAFDFPHLFSQTIFFYDSQTYKNLLSFFGEK